jgi:hypothetical protein
MDRVFAWLLAVVLFTLGLCLVLLAIFALFKGWVPFGR